MGISAWVNLWRAVLYGMEHLVDLWHDHPSRSSRLGGPGPGSSVSALTLSRTMNLCEPQLPPLWPFSWMDRKTEMTLSLLPSAQTQANRWHNKRSSSFNPSKWPNLGQRRERWWSFSYVFWHTRSFHIQRHTGSDGSRNLQLPWGLRQNYTRAHS